MTYAEKVPPAFSVIWPPLHRSGIATDPWYAAGSCWSPVGYQPELFWGMTYVPRDNAILTSPPPAPETHCTLKATLAFLKWRWASGWLPGMVKEIPAERRSPGLTLRSPSIAWGPMVMLGAAANAVPVSAISASNTRVAHTAPLATPIHGGFGIHSSFDRSARPRPTGRPSLA